MTRLKTKSCGGTLRRKFCLTWDYSATVTSNRSSLATAVTPSFKNCFLSYLKIRGVTLKSSFSCFELISHSELWRKWRAKQVNQRPSNTNKLPIFRKLSVHTHQVVRRLLSRSSWKEWSHIKSALMVNSNKRQSIKFSSSSTTYPRTKKLTTLRKPYHGQIWTLLSSTRHSGVMKKSFSLARRLTRITHQTPHWASTLFGKTRMKLNRMWSVRELELHRFSEHTINLA